MDILTLGFWGIIGTPIEALIIKKEELIITYDENNKVVGIDSFTLPIQEK